MPGIFRRLHGVRLPSSVENAPFGWRGLSVVPKFIIIIELPIADVGTVANIKKIVTERRTQAMESHG